MKKVGASAPELDQKLSFYLDQRSVSTRDKNLLMNRVWDLTTSSHAGRAALFENVNALPAFLLRQRLYQGFDRQPFIDRIKSLVPFETL